MALSAAAILFASSRILGEPLSIWWYVAAFFGAWYVYLLDSAASCTTEDAISQPIRAAVFRDSVWWCRVVPLVSAATALAALMLAVPTPTTWLVLTAIGALGLLHAARDATATTPSTRRRVKSLAMLKSPVVAAAWTVGAVMLPSLQSADIEGVDWMRAILLAGLLFPALLADSILLDLRDRTADRTYGMRTIAVRIGPRGTHALVGALLALMLVASIGTILTQAQPEMWRRLAIAVVLGLAAPWMLWRRLERDETAVNVGMMAWRFLAAAAMLGPTTIGSG